MSTPEIETAIDLTRRLRDAIAAELAGARRERLLLRDLDSNALFARAAERSSFLSETGRLERQLAGVLPSVARRLRISEATIERLRSCPSENGQRLAELLSEVRELTAALQQADRLNHELARRALVVVRGYVDALQPTPRAYDRFGGRSGGPALAFVSTKG